MKKQLTKISLASMLLAALVGCSKDNGATTDPTPDPAVTATTFTASVPSSTMETRMGVAGAFTTNGIVFSWEIADAVTLYDASGDAVGDFKVQSLDGDVATFGTDDNSLTLTVGDTYTIVYPASTASTLTERDAEDALSSQTISQAITSLSSTVRMKSEFEFSTTSAVELAHETAIIVYIFSTENNAVPTAISVADGSNSYAVSYGGSVSSEDSWYLAYIAVEPNSGERNLTMSVTTANGSETNVNVTTSVAYEAGKYYTAVVANGLYIFKASAIDQISASSPTVDFYKLAGSSDEAYLVVNGFSPANAMASFIACTVVIPVTYTESDGAIAFSADSSLGLAPETVGGETSSMYDVAGTEFASTKGTISADGVASLSSILMSGSMDEDDASTTPYFFAYNGAVTVTADFTPAATDSTTATSTIPYVGFGSNAW